MTDSRWEDVVRPTLPDLVKVLRPSDLVAGLFSSRLLTKDDVEKLDRCQSEEKASTTLLIIILPGKGPKAYDHFMEVLRKTEGQEFVADRLEKVEEGMPRPRVLDDNVISPAQAAALAASDTTVKPEQDVFVPVPCMETKKCDEDHAAYHSAICSSTSPPPLFLVLKGFSSFPEPLFYRFVSLFVAKWKSKPFLEGNRVVLHLADGLELELVYSTRAVIATVFPFDSEERPSDEEIRQHCIGVRESLVQELTHAIRNGMDDFHFELCVHPPIKPKCENDMYKDLACLDRYLIDSTLVKQNGQRIRTPKQLCLWYPAKEISKSVKMESTKLQPGPHVQSFTKVEKLVVKYGQSQWFSFGLELGFTKDEIDAACYDKPAPSQKLQTIICSKIQEIGAEKTRQKLLDACQCVPSPIYGIVKENLQTKE